MEEAFRGIQFDDGMGNMSSLPFVSYEELSGERKALYEASGCLSSMTPEDVVYSVKYEGEQGIVEHIVLWNGSRALPVFCECGISYELLSPTQMVEYQYEEGGDWRLAKISYEPMQAYKSHKFKMWREMLDKPSCEAAFLRMIKCGPINRLYDKFGFPIPEHEEADWKITDEKTGKQLDIPRPVFSLRIWNADTNSYTTVSPIMDGAPPTEEELAAYWQHTLEELREKHGGEYITTLLSR